MLKNGELLTAAEENDFEVLVTTDLNLKYQQNLEGRHMGPDYAKLAANQAKPGIRC